MTQKKAAKRFSPQLVFTGERRDDRYRVDVRGKPVWLAFASFESLVSLLLARLISESGFAELDKRAVRRLRRGLHPHGDTLIETGGSEEYRLAIAKEDIAERVGITPCFLEYKEGRIASKEKTDMLRGACRAWPADRTRDEATEKRPARDRKGTKRRPERP